MYMPYYEEHYLFSFLKKKEEKKCSAGLSLPGHRKWASSYSVIPPTLEGVARRLLLTCQSSPS